MNHVSRRPKESAEPATLLVDAEPASASHLESVIAGRYELLRPLGEGGFSWVFLARHTQIPSLRVAIKILKTANGHDPRALLRLEREAEMTAMLQGQHTVKVLDVGVTEGGYPYLAMEFVRGISLRYLIAKAGPLSTLTVARISLDVLASLRDAHAKNIVHRDLKPSNIFLTQEEGQAPSARVLDFGIAHLHTPLSSDTASSQHSLACTPQYAAPEVLRGEPEPRSDLYAHGLIMAELLEGAAMVRESNTFLAATHHLNDTPFQLGPKARRSALAPIIQRAISKDLQQRPRSADEMREHILELVTDLEAQGATDALDIHHLVQDYNEGVDLSPSIQAPVSLRDGVARRHFSAKFPAPNQPTIMPQTQRSVRLDSLSAADLAFIQQAHTVARSKRWILVLSAAVVVMAIILLAGGIVLQMRAPSAELQTPQTLAEQIDELPAVDPPSEIIVEGSINDDTFWQAATRYRLRGTVFVEHAATLTIEAGTTIIGESGAALVLTPNATLLARGRADAPITFTSTRGEDAQAGDWGGLVLLGDAPINATQGHVEGIPVQDPRGYYGGDDVQGSCGILEHVRIAYAGYEVFANNELNGLTLAGCGEGTIIRNLHVHASLDDGVEIFGGAPDLRYILITEPGDDGLDWDQGWTGNAQFVVIRMSRRGDNAIEADSNASQHSAAPRSQPTIANLSIFGPDDTLANARAILLRSGTGAHFINVLIQGFPLDPIDIRDAATVDNITSGVLSFEGLWIVPATQGLRFDDESIEDDDGGFDEESYFRGIAGARYNTPVDQWLQTPFGPLVPAASSLTASDAPMPKLEFFDRGARYIGAFQPGQSETWAF